MPNVPGRILQKRPKKVVFVCVGGDWAAQDADAFERFLQEKRLQGIARVSSAGIKNKKTLRRLRKADIIASMFHDPKRAKPENAYWLFGRAVQRIAPGAKKQKYFIDKKYGGFDSEKLFMEIVKKVKHGH